MCALRHKIIAVKEKSVANFFSPVRATVLALTEAASSSVCGRVELLTVKSGMARLAWKTLKQCCEAIPASAIVMLTSTPMEALCTYLKKVQQCNRRVN